MSKQLTASIVHALLLPVTACYCLFAALFCLENIEFRKWEIICRRDPPLTKIISDIWAGATFFFFALLHHFFSFLHNCATFLFRVTAPLFSFSRYCATFFLFRVTALLFCYAPWHFGVNKIICDMILYANYLLWCVVRIFATSPRLIFSIRVSTPSPTCLPIRQSQNAGLKRPALEFHNF